MRVIDADALIGELHTQFFYDGRDRTRVYAKIQDQPTVEPERKKGKWVVYKAPDKYHCGLCKCPFCDEEMIAESDGYNYCPNCGADMRGEQDGSD